MLSIAAICSGSGGPAEDILMEKLDLVEPEATEDVLIEQMDGILDSVGDETSSSDQSSLTSIIIPLHSGLTAGASLGFVLATLEPHPKVFFSLQVLTFLMTWEGSYGVSIPSRLSLREIVETVVMCAGLRDFKENLIIAIIVRVVARNTSVYFNLGFIFGIFLGKAIGALYTSGRITLDRALIVLMVMVNIALVAAQF